MVQDAEGREHRRTSGYMDAPRFVGELALARVSAAVDRRDWETAATRVDEALERVGDDPERRAEALFFSAVVAFRRSGEREDLEAGWNRLLDELPESEWARRAEYIRL